jgi:hypothetical protein
MLEGTDDMVFLDERKRVFLLKETANVRAQRLVCTQSDLIQHPSVPRTLPHARVLVGEEGTELFPGLA